MSNDNRLNEALSALADGECAELEGARVMKALRGSAAMRERWESLHTTRAAMRGERVDLLQSGFADRLSAALDDEAHILLPERNDEPETAPSRPWLKPIAGLAIAASVAAMSVFTLQSLQTPETQPKFVAGQTNGAVQAVPASATGTRWNLQRGEIEQRLNNYLLNHMEYATMGEMQGMLPYSRLAGYDRVPTQ